MEVVKLLLDYYFEVVNYFFNYNRNSRTSSNSVLMRIVWLPNSSCLLSEWFNCSQNYANTYSLFHLINNCQSNGQTQETETVSWKPVMTNTYINFFSSTTF